MSATYAFPLSAFPQTLVAPASLKREVAAAIPAVVCEGVTRMGDSVTVGFASALDTAQEATLAAAVAAHSGVDMGVVFHATSMVVGPAVQILTTNLWQELGGVITNPEFFLRDRLPYAYGQLSGQARVVGAGAELRIWEPTNGAPSTPHVLITGTLTDNGDAWSVVSFNAVGIPQTGGERPLILEGRLNGATSAWVRYMSASLMELVFS